MRNKKVARLKRAKRTRLKIKELQIERLSVHRTSRHIYAQIVSGDAQTVIASASTLDKTIKLDNTSNQKAAEEIGKVIAQKAKQAGITKVAFDRSGFKFHGRVKALADSARSQGLQF